MIKIHKKLLVTLSQDRADTAQHAKDYAYSYLTEEGFVGHDERFGGGYADWFVIGGRWSGCLLSEDALEEHDASVRKMVGADEKNPYLTTQQIEDNKEEIQALWEAQGNDGVSPLLRSTYRDDGYEDDAMIVDERIYQEHLEEFVGYRANDDDMGWIDIEYDECSRENLIGKWVVVVDYHF